MAKKILEDNEVLVAAAAEPEVLAGAEETESGEESTIVPTETETPSGDSNQNNSSSTEEMVGKRTKKEHLRLRLLGYI